ncbi:MAG: hypothetical protein JWL90_4360 [Chthoniobacteraceae bacterium]|nr:hypothetical protein [Chthoniobacteraceae bacterium]
MKLVTLDFQLFGCFSNLRLDFSQPGKQFHLIYGNNEAGKSTALRGLTNFFYGIPARTTDAFRHDAPALRIAAELLSAGGEELSCVRRKGNQNTLLSREEKALPEKLLNDFLGGLSEEAFTTIYRLDHETLVRGGEELREGRGDLAESLFQAGSGISGLRQVLKALDEEAGEIFKARAVTPLINRAINTYQSARKRSKELSVKPADWKEKQGELTGTEEKLKGEQVELARLQAELKRLDRVKLAWPPAASLRRVLNEIELLGEFIALPESATQERLDAERRERESTALEEQAREKIERIEGEIARLHAPEELILQALAITAAHQRLGRHQQARIDLPQLLAEVKRDQADADELLRDLRPDNQGGDSFHLSLLARERIETLAGRHSVLHQRVLDTADRKADATTDLAEARAVLQPVETTADPARLRQVLGRVQKEGDLQTLLFKSRAQLKLLDEQVARETARLGRWHGSAEELGQVTLPGMETVERFENEFSRCEQSHRDALLQAEQVREKLRLSETRIQALKLGGEVPTEHELEARRERREAGWQLVRRAWLEASRDEAGERTFNARKPLAEAYEEAVEEADSIADRLRREAARVGQLAELLAGQTDHQQRLTDAEEASTKARTLCERVQVEWEKAWSAIVPATPREMRAWLTQYEAVLRLLGEARQQRSGVEQTESLIKNRAAELREELLLFGEKAENRLDALVDCAGSLLTRIEETRGKREAWEKEIKGLNLALQKADREARQAISELDAWREEWSAAVAPLALGREPAASQALGVIRQIELFQQKKKFAEQGLIRIAAMEGAVANFEQEVSAIVETVAPDLRGVAADQAAIQLQARLTQAQKHAAQRQTLEKQLAQEKEQRESAIVQIRKSKADLVRLFEAAKCSTRGEVIVAEEKAFRARSLTNQKEELLRTVVPLSAGLPIEEFLIHLDGVHLDQLSLDAERVTGQIAEYETRIGQLQTARGKFQTELSVMDGGEQAADALEQAQQAAAEIESLSTRYVRLRLAAGILRRQIERYREENQGPVVRRASELFPRLTRNSFSALKTGFDEKDRPVLQGVRASGEEVSVTGMSEGTRDQLFLALRLASLERQMEGSEPVPFVLDDILMSFDDDRARDTLRVLADLCSRTQVLFFTHHAHLVELAKQAVPAGLLQLHDLGRSDSPDPSRLAV